MHACMPDIDKGGLPPCCAGIHHSILPVPLWPAAKKPLWPAASTEPAQLGFVSQLALIRLQTIMR